MEYNENFVFGEVYTPYQQPLPINTQYIRKYSEDIYAQDAAEYKNGAIRKMSCDPNDFKLKFKTEYCKYWKQSGNCPYKDQCAFAHGNNELRYKTHLPSNYKTKKCKNFFENGVCFYGERCQFLHIQKKDFQAQDEEEELNESTQSQPQSVNNSPVKYQTQLKEIDQYWDDKSMSFQTKKLQPQRPRLPTFELITKSNSQDDEDVEDEEEQIKKILQRPDSPSTQNESVDNLSNPSDN